MIRVVIDIVAACRETENAMSFRAMTSSLAILLSLFSISLQANIKRNIFGKSTLSQLEMHFSDDGLGFLSYPISLISDQDKGTRDADLGIWFSTMISANLHISKVIHIEHC